MALLKKMVILTAGENGDLDDEEDKNNEQEDHQEEEDDNLDANLVDADDDPDYYDYDQMTVLMTVSKTTYQFHQVEMKRDSVPFLSKRQFNNPFFQFPCLLTNCFALIIHQSNGNHAQIQIKLLEDCRYSVGVSRNAVFG